MVSASLTSFEGTSGDADLAPQEQGDIRLGGAAALVVRQTAGSWRGSYSEVGYRYDARFESPNRLFLLGRLVLTPNSGDNGGIGAFIEGSVSTDFGRRRDEARLSIGIKLDTLAILRAVVGGKTSVAPG